MNILEHPIYKDIYDLCLAIEKLQASEQETKCVVMASNLERPAAKLIGTVREIKRIVLNMMPNTTQRDLARIIRLCIDAGVTQKIDELKTDLHDLHRQHLEQTMGDTPRTNAFIEAHEYKSPSKKQYAAHARQLERELIAVQSQLRAENEQLRADAMQLASVIKPHGANPNDEGRECLCSLCQALAAHNTLMKH